AHPALHSFPTRRSSDLYYTGVKRSAAERANIDGTRAMLDLAQEAPKLRRLVHFSTARVSGSRPGVVLEEELDEGQRFHDVYEERSEEHTSELQSRRDLV